MSAFAATGHSRASGTYDRSAAQTGRSVNRLFSVTISSQQQLVDQLMQHKLKDRYFRLDALPSNEQAKDLGLDVANETARRTLMALGKKAASDILNTKLAPFLTHEPQMVLVRGG